MRPQFKTVITNNHIEALKALKDGKTICAENVNFGVCLKIMGIIYLTP